MSRLEMNGVEGQAKTLLSDLRVHINNVPRRGLGHRRVHFRISGEAHPCVTPLLVWSTMRFLIHYFALVDEQGAKLWKDYFVVRRKKRRRGRRRSHDYIIPASIDLRVQRRHARGWFRNQRGAGSRGSFPVAAGTRRSASWYTFFLYPFW